MDSKHLCNWLPISGDGGIAVVIHSISTSNHNRLILTAILIFVVIHSISTSNHNEILEYNDCRIVVIHSISTSNHNGWTDLYAEYKL